MGATQPLLLYYYDKLSQIVNQAQATSVQVWVISYSTKSHSAKEDDVKLVVVSLFHQSAIVAVACEVQLVLISTVKSEPEGLTSR